MGTPRESDAVIAIVDDDPPGFSAGRLARHLTTGGRRGRLIAGLDDEGVN
jgi:hypothetical protein